MRPCIGCGALLQKGSRCKACQRPTARQRGYDTRWEKTREAFIAACPVCERCGARAEHVHHIDGLGPRGPRGHDWENLESLCASCHNAHTATEKARRRL